MKSFKLIAYQNEASVSVEFKLSESKAIKDNFVVGTAINEFFKRFEAGKKMKARIFDGREPVNIKIEHTQSGFAVDSAAADAGIEAIKSTYTDKLKLNGSERSKKQFAQNVWTIYQMLRSELRIVSIETVVKEKTLLSEGKELPLIKAPVKKPVKALPLPVGSGIMELVEG